ncbi:MAG: hypothetical protein RB191_24935 [Terriglobia bacterium]|nr:hypothetical protein [Terriglobia bacterium]
MKRSCINCKCIHTTVHCWVWRCSYAGIDYLQCVYCFAVYYPSTMEVDDIAAMHRLLEAEEARRLNG